MLVRGGKKGIGWQIPEKLVIRISYAVDPELALSFGWLLHLGGFSAFPSLLSKFAPGTAPAHELLTVQQLLVGDTPNLECKLSRFCNNRTASCQF